MPIKYLKKIYLFTIKIIKNIKKQYKNKFLFLVAIL